MKKNTDIIQHLAKFLIKFQILSDAAARREGGHRIFYQPFSSERVRHPLIKNRFKSKTYTFSLHRISLFLSGSIPELCTFFPCQAADVSLILVHLKKRKIWGASCFHQVPFLKAQKSHLSEAREHGSNRGETKLRLETADSEMHYNRLTPLKSSCPVTKANKAQLCEA